MKVSVIIVHYNTPKLLENCLASFYDSNQSVAYEVIIVDNASDERINKEKLIESYNNISFIDNKENLGFAKANNLAAKQAVGEYLFLLNSDTIVNQDILKPMISFYQKTKKIGILGPRLLNQNRSIQFYGSIFGRYKYLGSAPRQVSFISGAAMFINKDLYLLANGFDENYFFYNEDLDLCKTFQRLGYKNYYHPEIKLVHLGGASTIKSTFLKKQALKSSLYFFKKFYLS